MDAILFSANPKDVNFDDAFAHLDNHEKLYWEVLFPIIKEKFTLPMDGYIHVSGTKRVKYRATIIDILPFDKKHYEDTRRAKLFKPERWRWEWKANFNGVRDKPWKEALVMTKIEDCLFETLSFEKETDGQHITLVPRKYVCVRQPRQTAVGTERSALLDSHDLLAHLDRLDERRGALFRTEQRILRMLVVGTHGIAKCQLCGRDFSTELLVAAHIKPRAACTETERRDIGNVIALCKLGCDELFERGYVIVRDGSIQRSARTTTEAVRKYVDDLAGKSCPGWTVGRKSYFEWRAHAVGQRNSH